MSKKRKIALKRAIVLGKTRAQSLDQVKHLNFWGSDLEDVSLLMKMPRIKILSLSVNKIQTLEDFRNCKCLEELYLRKNGVRSLSELWHVKNLNLKTLWLSDNPCDKEENYRLKVISIFPNLKKLDDKDVSEEEREEAQEMFTGWIDTVKPSIYEEEIAPVVEPQRQPEPQQQKQVYRDPPRQAQQQQYHQPEPKQMYREPSRQIKYQLPKPQPAPVVQNYARREELVRQPQQLQNIRREHILKQKKSYSTPDFQLPTPPQVRPKMVARVSSFDAEPPPPFDLPPPEINDNLGVPGNWNENDNVETEVDQRLQSGVSDLRMKIKVQEDYIRKQQEEMNLNKQIMIDKEKEMQFQYQRRERERTNSMSLNDDREKQVSNDNILAAVLTLVRELNYKNLVILENEVRNLIIIRKK